MIKPHISPLQKENVVKKYRAGSLTVAQLALSLDVERSTIYRWIKKSLNKKPLKRNQNSLSGRQPKINLVVGRKLVRLLKKPASKFGYETDFWNTTRIRQVLKKELEINVSRMAIHRTLIKFEQSYKKPERRYYHKDKEKNLEEWRRKKIPAIKRAIARHRAILYFEDESSISLTPSLARTWAPVGEKITREVSPNRGSVSAISAISKSGHLIFNVHDGSKRFNSDDIINFLRQMLQHHKRRHLVVIMDQAPCHKSNKVKTFVKEQKRLHVFYLPPRSPEFNPDENVWAHLKEKELKQHKATSTKELKKIASKKLKKMSRDKKLLKGVFRRSEGADFF